MKIEHLALQMKDPVKAAKWYVDNLGFTIVKQMESSPFCHFIIDQAKEMLLEIFRLPDKEVPDYKALDPSIMHLGFSVENIEAVYEELISSGATLVSEISISKTGDKIAMLRDPWGLPIQLIKRKQPLVD